MISESLVFLRNQLNQYLGIGRDPNELQEDLVVFLDTENHDTINFKKEAISLVLINIEEETTFRSANQYVRTTANGIQQNIQPDIKLNLYILFVPLFTDYQTSLKYLSKIIRYFQKFRLIDHQNSPLLHEDIQKLIIELVTLNFAEQNEIWNALRTPYLPSVLYKVKMVVFEDDESTEAAAIQEMSLRQSK